MELHTEREPGDFTTQLRVKINVTNAGGRSTLLRRGWVRYGSGRGDVSYSVPVRGLAVPGAGMIRPRLGMPAVIWTDVADMTDWTQALA